MDLILVEASTAGT